MIVTVSTEACGNATQELHNKAIGVFRGVFVFLLCQKKYSNTQFTTPVYRVNCIVENRLVTTARFKRTLRSAHTRAKNTTNFVFGFVIN